MSATVIPTVEHYKESPELPFTADQKPYTTILFGPLTSKHDPLIRSVFLGAGYNCENLPTPVRSAHEVGKEFCNNGLCNPNYFTAGNLIQYVRKVQAETGMSREDIVKRFLYFSAGGCGPCRFGMYESEYRLAAENAGFHGFRILTFDTNRVIRDRSEQPGLVFTMDFAMGIFNALNLGDVLYETHYQIRPYEVVKGSTDAAMAECLQMLCDFLRTRRHFHVLERSPRWLAAYLKTRDKQKRFWDNWSKFLTHLYGKDFLGMLKKCRERLNQVEVDRTRMKPRVKIVGEFFAQISEGEANYNMFKFLEREGAEPAVDSPSSLLMYWLHQARMHNQRKKGIQQVERKKEWYIRIGSAVYRRQFRRVADMLGGLAGQHTSQEELARLAAPWYDPLARGGEGHLEVAKSIYYTLHRKAHMVLSLKPFGCMPSTQSDGVMARVTAQYADMIFLPIETASDGEINALSRVQMALGDARRKARAEFDEALRKTGRSLEEIRAWVAEHPEVRRPFYDFGAEEGVAGTAARFILHIGERMKREPLRGGMR